MPDQLRSVFGLTVLGCLMVPQAVRAGESRAIPLDKLPHPITEIINQSYPGAELLSAQREIEDDKACYVVTIRDKGKTIALYSRPNGSMLARKEAAAPPRELLEGLIGPGLLLLLPVAIAGAFARLLVQAASPNRLSVLAEWAAAWLGGMLLIAIVLFNVATVPRDKDGLVIGALCVVWGGVAASLVEVLGLTAQSLRGYRPVRRWWVLGLCLAAASFLALWVPVNRLRVERENQYYRVLALRTESG